MTDIQVATAAKKLIDAEYHLGPGPGFDCLSMVIEFYGNLGVKFPSEFRGFTMQNYADKWLSGEGREEFMDFLMDLGEEVQLNYERAGDLLIFEVADAVFPAVYLGSGNMICAFEKGVMVIPMKFYRKSLATCRRLVN